MKNDYNQTLRGIVDLTPVEVEELNLLKEKIFSKKGDRAVLKEEFERKAQYLQAKIPPLYWDIGWDEFIGDDEAKNFTKKYCDMIPEALEAGQGIIFSGHHGTGKTTLSCLIAKEAMAKGYTARYVPVAKLIDMIMRSFDDKEWKEAFETIIGRVEFLILDDVGKEYLGVRKQLNPMMQLQFDEKLRERGNRCLVTIVSTNYDKKAILDQYGDSVFSILHGCSKFMEVKGKDYRLIKNTKFWERFNG